MATRTNFAGDFLKRQYTAVVTRKTRTDQTSDHQAENPSVTFHSGISLSGYSVSVKEATCLHTRKIICQLVEKYLTYHDGAALTNFLNCRIYKIF